MKKAKSLTLDASDDVCRALGDLLVRLCAEERAKRGLTDTASILDQADNVLRVATQRLLDHAAVLHAMAGAREPRH
ncbi:hypothetical protein BJG93_02175 [Paraburkholderia sprentiae WSM5005]|uniref:Uncharacterized protein n=1 Tax=Paraburkholderia sprentiae WSM5005 TaxID=754502 RepID=A0A1I9YDE8_9BURK|nr:hypothetical protein [Paraburkholderia sprentiae]APA84331.1 hypothetical protein BJG93_02175 [Paraburkholderia sprentiae WSM5005]